MKNINVQFQLNVNFRINLHKLSSDTYLLKYLGMFIILSNTGAQCPMHRHVLDGKPLGSPISDHSFTIDYDKTM